MSTRFLLVRHGACERMDDLLFGRVIDVPLSRRGRMQSARLAQGVDGLPVLRIEASPRVRAQQTAQPMAERLGCTVLPCAELDEVDFGRWAGQPFQELALDPEWRRWNQQRDSACTPAGETMAGVQKRIVDHMRRLAAESLRAHANDVVVLVTHAEVIRAALLYCLHEPFGRYATLRIDPACVSTVEVSARAMRVLGVNRSTLERTVDA
ncbi:MAG TPA: histidine phosphatase family protein [Steroidobacter sp.]|nr:histidine phosphatase family protein [Steroidobacteraceae bacterium]HLS80232.1 histidine phosphatase family protein [Steroidobacter sp.]